MRRGRGRVWVGRGREKQIRCFQILLARSRFESKAKLFFVCFAFEIYSKFLRKLTKFVRRRYRGKQFCSSFQTAFNSSLRTLTIG